MAIEIIDQANPSPLGSQLPPEALVLARSLHPAPLNDEIQTAVSAYRRAADYIAAGRMLVRTADAATHKIAAMIFLKDNAFLERDLEPTDIKSRLLGHWGTCPGLNLIHAHANLIIQKFDIDMIEVIGPGHGAPAALACAWLDGSLEKFYPECAQSASGLRHLVANFSLPTGFPSHVNAQTPGAIHEGGELGYVLSVAYGSVMDQPDLVTLAIIGDGEAETGPTATAWHAHKYIDPRESGAVLPILHVNGFKISERTISGCMDNRELSCLFSGYGYEPCIVENLEDIDSELNAAMSWAVARIQEIQRAARSGKPMIKPRWPMIILRTPKGWGCPKKLRGEWIEGSFRAHQVPLPHAKSDPEELQALQEWLLSYKPKELFPFGYPTDSALSILPKKAYRILGKNPVSWYNRTELLVPDWVKFTVLRGSTASCLKTAGLLLNQTIKENKNSLRIFSPDELVSNKLDAVFETTSRNFQCDQYSMNRGGQVVEILSEHTCQGFLQGYTMTGRTGIFPTYESFLPIVTTMVVQYSKFLKISAETPWRKDLSSLNYISTSTWTRQEHNGYSHQNPGFIGTVLAMKPSIARVYLPPDANCFLSTLAHCLRSKNYVNLIVGSKHDQPVWLSPEEANSHCTAGVSVWKFCSTDNGLDPDVVLVGIGADLMFEVVAASVYLHKLAPHLRVRTVNVTDLMVLELDGSHPHSLTTDEFDNIFTPDRNIHFNYHGYPVELQGLLFGRAHLERISLEGYQEEGTTTTPFDMVIRNRCSRYHVALAAVKGAARHNPAVALDMQELTAQILHDLSKTHQYILKHGEDPKGMYDTPVFPHHHPGYGHGWLSANQTELHSSTKTKDSSNSTPEGWTTVSSGNGGSK